MVDFYQYLGVSINASQSEIKRAYINKIEAIEKSNFDSKTKRYKKRLTSLAFNTIKNSGTVSIGDTYVVSSKFGIYQAGDFLIAKSKTNKEINGFISTADLDWNHVKSGYDASLDQKLTGADNKIKLSTGTGLAGTEVAFTATGSASVAVADNTVTIGMVWEDFN